MFNHCNVELTSRCNKNCYFCGRRKAQIEYGDMDIKLFENILNQMNGLEIIQFHLNGEPLLSPYLGEVLELCHKKGIISNIVSNGKNMTEKIPDLDKCTTLTISVFEQDDEQLLEVETFIASTDNPKVFIKLIGDYEGREYYELGLPILRRQLHSSNGSRDYQKKKPTISETGICMDIFKPAINWKGEMFLCCRFDPERKGLLGDLTKSTIHELWYGDKRRQWLEYHKEGKKDLVPLCNGCEYFGIPTS